MSVSLWILVLSLAALVASFIRDLAKGGEKTVTKWLIAIVLVLNVTVLVCTRIEKKKTDRREYESRRADSVLVDARHTETLDALKAIRQLLPSASGKRWGGNRQEAGMAFRNSLVELAGAAAELRSTGGATLRAIRRLRSDVSDIPDILDGKEDRHDVLGLIGAHTEEVVQNSDLLGVSTARCARATDKSAAYLGYTMDMMMQEGFSTSVPPDCIPALSFAELELKSYGATRDHVQHQLESGGDMLTKAREYWDSISRSGTVSASQCKEYARALDDALAELEIATVMIENGEYYKGRRAAVPRDC